MDTKFVSINSGIRQVSQPASSSQQSSGRNPGLVALNEPSAAEGKTQDPSTVGVKAAEAKQDEEPDRASLDKVVADLNRNIQQTTRALIFTIDERHGKPIVSVVDKETDKVIRQIPSEVALQVADALDEVTGALVSEHA